MFDGGEVNDGLSPLFFGPPMWMTLHCLASGFPYNYKTNEEKERRKRFPKVLVGLIKSLPCYTCRDNSLMLIDKIKKFNFRTCTRREVELFLCDLHNMVNQKLNKKVLTQEECLNVLHVYESARVGFNNGQNRSKLCGKTQIFVKSNDAEIKSSIVVDKTCLIPK